MHGLRPMKSPPATDDPPCWRSCARQAGLWYFCTWPLGVGALWAWSPTAAVGHFAATHVLALYGALRANSQIFGRVVQRFATTEREVWITIDDGPFPEDTAALLEVLARQGAPATFFLEGARVQSAPELAQRITATGHTLGNHSHTHPVSRFWALGPRGARRELEACSAALRAAADAEPVGFRPPVGMANGFVHVIARRLGLPVIGWSARGYDGLDRDPARVTERLLARLAPGAILLLHQRREGGSAAILDRLLTGMRERGYRCVVPAAERFIAG